MKNKQISIPKIEYKNSSYLLNVVKILFLFSASLKSFEQNP